MHAVESVRAATDRSIKAAVHLTDMDKGAIAAIKELASLIDESLAGVGMSGRGLGGSDNLFTSYLKMCDSLGLTPAGRNKLGDDLKQTKTGSKLARLRAVHEAG